MVDYGTVAATRVRRPAPALRTVRRLFRWLTAISPGVAATAASYVYSIPGRKRNGQREREILSRGSRSTVAIEGHRLAAWQWGRGPTVLLAHGWGSRAGRMTSLVDPLVSAGFRVVAYDHPAHGESSGRTTNMPELARVMRGMAGEVGPFHAVVGHSMGGAASALAISEGLAVSAAVMIAPPEDMKYFSAVYAGILQLEDEVLDRMNERLVRMVGRQWSDLRAGTIARGQTTPLLVVHDSQDADVPHSHGAAWAREWPGASLHTTSSLGHKDILRNEEVLARVSEFLRENLPGRPSGAVALAG